MTPKKKAYTLKLDPDLLAALNAIRARDGINVSEQLRRAAWTWVESKDVMKPGRKRAATRKKGRA
jgi:Ribbon-helix-helix protein, copG family